MNKPITITILFMFIAIVLIMNNTYYHENAHNQIGANFGCIRSELEYFPNPHFKCLERSYNLSEEDWRIHNSLHAINEIVGYNVSTMYASILLCSFLICMTILIAGENDANDKHNR